MSNKDKVVQLLRSIAPTDLGNSEIVSRTGIRPHQQVFQITRELLAGGKINGRQYGKEWRFWCEAENALSASPKPTAKASNPPSLMPEAPAHRNFEDQTRLAMSKHFGVELLPRRIPGLPKLFDLVSPDFNVVGDAKFFTLVRGLQQPPAKFSIIAEHV